MHNVLRVLLICFAMPIFAISPVSGSDAELSSKNEPVSHLTAQGFCCINGRISASDEKSCQARKGQYSVDKIKLQKSCPAKPPQSKKTTLQPQPTQKKKAVPITTPVNGYCCNEAKVISATSSICAKRKGVFSTSRREVEKKCGEKEMVRFMKILSYFLTHLERIHLKIRNRMRFCRINQTRI